MAPFKKMFIFFLHIKNASFIAAKTNTHCKDKPVKKDNCPFCKEKKKKPLATYIRRRELCKRTESICEEAEEEEEEEEETCKSQGHSHNHVAATGDKKNGEDTKKKKRHNTS